MLRDTLRQICLQHVANIAHCVPHRHLILCEKYTQRPTATAVVTNTCMENITFWQTSLTAPCAWRTTVQRIRTTNRPFTAPATSWLLTWRSAFGEMFGQGNLPPASQGKPMFLIDPWVPDTQQATCSCKRSAPVPANARLSDRHGPRTRGTVGEQHPRGLVTMKSLMAV